MSKQMKKLKQIVNELSMGVGGGISGLGSTAGSPIAGYDTIMRNQPVRRNALNVYRKHKKKKARKPK